MSQKENMREVQHILSEEFGLDRHPDKGDFINHLSLRINELIVEDFEKLVLILYRIDVSEQKLKEMLDKYIHDDAGYIIAQLIIDRQLQKIETRRQFDKNENIPGEDKW